MTVAQISEPSQRFAPGGSHPHLELDGRLRERRAQRACPEFASVKTARGGVLEPSGLGDLRLAAPGHLIDLRSGATLGAEALVRRQHPTRGLLYPDAFLPLVEQS